MLTNFLIVWKQIVVMLLLVAVGYYMYRIRVLNNDITKSFTVMLNKFIAPCFLINSFHRPFDANQLKSLMTVFFLGMALYGLAIFIVSRLFPKTNPDYPDLRTASILTNNGFMGFPLLNAMFGAVGVFYCAAHNAAMNVLIWTYGVHEFSHGKERIRLRQVFANPAMLSIYVGLLVFCTPFDFPEVIYQTMETLGNLNTPLAMMTLGCFMAQVDLKTCFRDKRVWRITALRLLVFPYMCMAILLFIPMDPICKKTLITDFCVPTALATAMFAQLYNTNYLLCTSAIAVNTLLSAITLPISVAVMDFLMLTLGG